MKWTDGMSRRRRAVDFLAHRLMRAGADSGVVRDRLFYAGRRLCFIATEVPSRILG